ncbi:MAG: contact-dependent growth inhibition system immunity protein [Pseudomonadota bacterium]
MKSVDHLTIEQLEADVWAEPDFNSHLVTTCHQLRKKRLGDFSVEDLRIMLGQSIGAKYLLPKAIEILRENPFAEGDFFEGDLLVAIARHPRNATQLAPEDARHLLAASVAAVESVDPKLRRKDLSAVQGMVDALSSHVRRQSGLEADIHNSGGSNDQSWRRHRLLQALRRWPHVQWRTWRSLRKGQGR